jgi:uncharacterized protein
MEFEWDPNKAAGNLRKHEVSFEEAATAFGDPLSIIVPDPDHSVQEDRYLVIGTSAQLRLLIVSFAERGDHIRIISARRLTRSERKAYEEETHD